MFTLSGKGDGWKGVILGILICLLAAGLYYRSKLPPLSQANSAGAAAGRKPLQKAKDTPLFAGNISTAPSRQWRTYWTDDEKPALRFTKIAGVFVSGGMKPDRRVIISGIFQADNSFVHAALMSFEDYQRAQAGYPPLDVQFYAAQGKPFQTTVKPGMNEMAFFQTPPRPDLAQARSMASLLALSLQGLVGAPAASVSAEIRTEYQIFGTSAEASQARCDMLRNWGEAGKSWLRLHPEWCGSDSSRISLPAAPVFGPPIKLNDPQGSDQPLVPPLVLPQLKPSK